jgi:hypothetical protein
VPAAADRATRAARNGQHCTGDHEDDSYHPEDGHVEEESRDQENDSENDQCTLLERMLTVTGRAEKRAGSSVASGSSIATGPPPSHQRLEGEQSVEEIAVTAEREAHILRGRLIAFPLPFE